MSRLARRRIPRCSRRQACHFLSASLLALGLASAILAQGLAPGEAVSTPPTGLPVPADRDDRGGKRETSPLELIAIDAVERRLVARDPRGLAGDLLVLTADQRVALREGGECSELHVGEIGATRVSVQLECAEGERAGWLTLRADGSTHWLAILRTPPPEPHQQIEVSMSSAPSVDPKDVAPPGTPPGTLVTRRAEP